MVDMTDSAKETTDPRIRRTRQLLQQALLELLQKKRFEEISVQDISAVSTINRATFYAHYTDKFALLESLPTREPEATGNDRLKWIAELMLGALQASPAN